MHSIMALLTIGFVATAWADTSLVEPPVTPKEVAAEQPIRARSLRPVAPATEQEKDEHNRRVLMILLLGGNVRPYGSINR